MREELAAFCTFCWSRDSLRQLRSCSMWQAVQFQVVFWTEARLLPLFCLALTFSTYCAAFLAGFSCGSTLTYFLCSPFLVVTSQAVAAVREWWHDFSKDSARWRLLLRSGWRTFRDSFTEEMTTASPDRLCLCVGISQYASGYAPLERAVADARAVARAFGSLGYTSHVVENARHTQDLEQQIDNFLATVAAQTHAQRGRDGQTMVVVIYFAGHGLEFDQGGLHLCMSCAGHPSCAGLGFMQGSKLVHELVMKLLNTAGPSQKLACVAFWDCCRIRSQVHRGEVYSAKRELGTKKHQHAEIKACLLGRTAQDGSFADALTNYITKNEPYSVQELYEHVGATVMSKTYNRQMCELVCESTELSQRLDLFVTPTKWAEHCAKLEALKSAELERDGEHSSQREKEDAESALLTENLEYRAEAQRLQDERAQMQQMAACLSCSGQDATVQLAGSSLMWRVTRVFLQLCCMCGALWSMTRSSLVEDGAAQQLEEEFQKLQAEEEVAKMGFSALVGLLFCATTALTVCSLNLRSQKRKLEVETHELSQNLHQAATENQQLVQELARHRSLPQQLPTLLRNMVGQTLQWDKVETHLRHSQQELQAAQREARRERERREGVEHELQILKDEHRRDIDHRRASVFQCQPGDEHERLGGGTWTHCCLCGQKGIGTGTYWRSIQNGACSFCTLCIQGR